MRKLHETGYCDGYSFQIMSWKAQDSLGKIVRSREGKVIKFSS